jgi:hypothetical protein
MAANREREPTPAGPAGWLLDIVDLAVGLVPGGRVAQRLLGTFERAVLRELKNRLERLDREASDSAGASADGAAPPAEPREESTSPAAILAGLLDRSLEETPEQARAHTFVTLLRQLVPDEARIVAALSDGHGEPVVHLTAASTLRASTRRVLTNVSSVGQTAGVQLREMTAYYVSHLAELGLVELAPEDPSLTVKYEILESSTQVREAADKIERGERLTKARIVRRTVRLTELGRDLWNACQASLGGGGPASNGSR